MPNIKYLITLNFIDHNSKAEQTALNSLTTHRAKHRPARPKVLLLIVNHLLLQFQPEQNLQAFQTSEPKCSGILATTCKLVLFGLSFCFEGERSLLCGWCWGNIPGWGSGPCDPSGCAAMCLFCFVRFLVLRQGFSL